MLPKVYKHTKRRKTHPTGLCRLLYYTAGVYPAAADRLQK